MLPCFVASGPQARIVHLVDQPGFAGWLGAAEPSVRDRLGETGFRPKPGAVAFLPGGAAVLVASDPAEPWDVAALYAALPAGDWRLEDAGGLMSPAHAALGWALAAYRFTRYHADDSPQPRLALP